MSQPDQEEVQDEQQEEEEDQQGGEQQQQQQEDEEEDGDGQQQDEDNEQEQQQQDQQEQQQQSKQQMPKFGTPKLTEPTEFKFQSLLSEISSLKNSVDCFISTLPSQGGSRSYKTSIASLPYQSGITYNAYEHKKPQMVIMKDEDIQVSMQPQIIIQPTIKKQESKQPFKVSNESQKFLAQLYEQNKKLKRWQNATNSSACIYQDYIVGLSKEKFQRKQYQKGIFNIEDRNKQIDEAIQMLRRQQSL